MCTIYICVDGLNLFPANPSGFRYRSQSRTDSRSLHAPKPDKTAKLTKHRPPALHPIPALHYRHPLMLKTSAKSCPTGRTTDRTTFLRIWSGLQVMWWRIREPLGSLPGQTARSMLCNIRYAGAARDINNQDGRTRRWRCHKISMLQGLFHLHPFISVGGAQSAARRRSLGSTQN